MPNTLNPNYISVQDSGQQGMYREQSVINAYRRDEGILVLPLASPKEDGTTCEVVRVHQPVAFRDVSYRMCKQFTPPTVPGVIPLSDIDGSARDCLLGQSVDIPTPGIVEGPQGGVPVWTVSGTQTYVAKIPRSNTDGYETTDPRIAGLTNAQPPAESDDEMRAQKAQMQNGEFYLWPFTTVSACFFDPTYLTSHAPSTE
jgi:hypothetical protein